MKRIVAVVAVAGIVGIAAAGCSKDDGPSATVHQVDRARQVQMQSNDRTHQLEQQIDGLKP